MAISKNIEDKIMAAVHELVSEGVVSPTNLQVREKIGGGSMSNISPVMQKWRKEQEDSLSEALTFPEGLGTLLNKTALTFWKVALEEAEKKFEERKIEMERFKESHEELSRECLAKNIEIESYEEKLLEELEQKTLLKQENEILRSQVGDLRVAREADFLAAQKNNALKDEYNSKLEQKNEKLTASVIELKEVAAKIRGELLASNSINEDLQSRLLKQEVQNDGLLSALQSALSGDDHSRKGTGKRRVDGDV